MGKRLSRERLIELYHEKDMTQGEIGEEVGVSQPTVGKWMREADVDTKKPRDEDLKEDLRRVAEELGETPSYDKYREHGEYGANTVKRRFDGWNAAKEAAGIETRAPDRKVSQEELLDDLQRVAEQLEKSPTQRELNEHGEYAHKLYYDRFDGGLTEAKERAGLTPNQVGRRVTVSCANCGEELERLHSDIAEKENVFCSDDCLAEYRSEKYSGHGNPMSTLKEVECDSCGAAIQRPRWDRERYDLHFCDNDCYGDWCGDVRHGENHPVWTEYPTLECEWCGKAYKTRPAKADDSRFCSLECINSWKSEEYQTDTERFTYMGRNWPEQRQKAILRDQARCQHCGLIERKHVDEFGCGLEVHHIESREEHRDEDGSLDHEAANRLENLISYCKRCHRLAEAEKIEPR